MITTENLTKDYNGQTVLSLPSLHIRQGEAFGLVGNNGAGKTTFFRLILDLIRATTGQVKVLGENSADGFAWKQFTGSYLDDSFLIDFLTPEEYFEFLAGVYHLPAGDLEIFYAQFKTFFNGEVLDGRKRYIRDLSRGNQQKVGIAAALLPRPKLLVLDEPFNGLDPTTQIRLTRLLNEINQQQQTTLLISSHDLNHVTEVCRRIVVLHKGEVQNDIIRSEDTLKELERYFAV